MPATQSSPWAGVPFNPDVTMADMQPQSSVWAPPDEQQQAINIPQMSQGPQLVPKIDLHKPMTQIFAPAPEPSAQDEIAGNLKGRLEKDYEKDANPMGSANNHPGFFGKLAHGLSHALGGDTRRQWEEQGLAKNINDLESNESLNRERNATAGHTEAETPEVAPNAESTRGLQGATAEHLNQETEGLKNPQPNLAQAYAHAVNQALASGKDPAQDPVVQHLADAITSLQPGQNKPGGPAKTTDIKLPNGQVHTMGWDDKTQKYDIDEGESGFKPAVTNVNAGGAHEFAEQERGRGLLDKAEGAYRTAQQGANGIRAAVDDAMQGGKMSAKMLPLEGALEITTAQGVHRINRTEVDQYAGGGSLFDRLAGALRGGGTGIPFTNEIMQDMKRLADLQEKGAYANYKGAYDSATKRYHLTDEQALRGPEGAGGGAGAPPPGAKIVKWSDIPTR